MSGIFKDTGKENWGKRKMKKPGEDTVLVFIKTDTVV